MTQNFGGPFTRRGEHVMTSNAWKRGMVDNGNIMWRGALKDT